ncbi:MarR family transcriptional regulator [Streptomyces sp. ACA25]|nr:MarR family transcriptional regulator [Streptomyces sp. ACA25]MDB1086025.1 MarR family transcriptional regulator [Streptomyces sp. ACA25]
MQRMASRVLACLLAEDSGALTSAELAERLQVSPAAVSGAIAYLAQVHMITRERQPGSRRQRYRLHSQVWFEALTNRDAQLNRWQGTLRDGARAVGPDSAAGLRLEETADFFAFLQVEMRAVLSRWEEHRGRSAEPGPPPEQARPGTHSAHGHRQPQRGRPHLPGP